MHRHIPQPAGYTRASTEAVRPNFLIVGGAKCGTTSLYDYLRQHPDVYMPGTKEPHFFVHKPSTYLWHRTFDEYLGLFADGAGKQAIGEASTGYLVAPESPRWIREILGPIKIVILLRNPARRAYSLWGQLVKQGMEGVSSFERALEIEEQRRTDPDFHRTCLQLPQDYCYFANGLYFEMVRRYLDVFGRDHVYVGLFEDLAADPITFCQGVYSFLEIDPTFVPEIMIHNPGRLPRSIRLQHWIERLLMNREYGEAGARTAWAALRFLPREARGRILLSVRRWNVRLGRQPTMQPRLYEQLMERYRPDIEKLERLLGRSLAVWYR